jgi:hypothetical protein
MLSRLKRCVTSGPKSSRPLAITPSAGACAPCRRDRASSRWCGHRAPRRRGRAESSDRRVDAELDSVPPGRSTRSAGFERLLRPSASMETSTPRPSVSRMISSTGRPGEVDDVIGAHALRHLQALRHAIDANDAGRAHEPRAGGGAESDRALREDGDRVADPNLPLSAPENPVDMMSGHISTCSSSGRPARREVRHRIGDEHVLSLRSHRWCCRTSSRPSASSRVSCPAVLRMAAAEGGVAVAARANRAGDDALPFA